MWLIVYQGLPWDTVDTLHVLRSPITALLLALTRTKDCALERRDGADLSQDYGPRPECELPVKVDEVSAKLRAQDVRASASAIIEVALLGLLGRRDLADVLRRHGAKARRD